MVWINVQLFVRFLNIDSIKLWKSFCFKNQVKMKIVTFFQAQNFWLKLVFRFLETFERHHYKFVSKAFFGLQRFFPFFLWKSFEETLNLFQSDLFIVGRISANTLQFLARSSLILFRYFFRFLKWQNQRLWLGLGRV
jgi:hypothetical protein